MKIISYDVEIKSTKINRAFTTPKVYTNDLNSVVFQFNVLDMTAEELAGTTATTLLYMNDGSFFQNPATDVILNGNVFSYTLKENEGNHSGTAQIQLVVKIGTKEYATQLYNFDVVIGLETKVAQEVMIHDWTTLTREARAFLDDAELAETGRVTAEGNRVTAENNRVTAESGRVTAESGRVTAESGRVTTFAGYNARITGMEADTTMMATNKVVNGEFIGLTGWSAIYAALSAANNVLSITGDGTNATPRAYQITTGKITANTKIYASQIVKVTNAVCSNITIELKSDPTLSALGVFGSVTSPTQNVAYRVSGIVQAPSGYGNNNIVLFVRNTYADGATASGKVLQLSVPIVLNLTEVFGVGNEPTTAQMDRLLTQFPNSWFTGTENLFLAKWALNELRRLDNDKANKAQEAWINPTLVNGATGTFQYRKNEFGRLEFKGELTQVSTANYFAITIAGYRPSAWIRCPITSIDGVVSMLIISDGGALYLHTPLAGKTISFSGISINIQ